MSARNLSPTMAAMSARLTACAASNARGETWDFHIIARGAGQHRTARALARRGLAIVSGSHVRPSRDTYALASATESLRMQEVRRMSAPPEGTDA